MPVWAQPEDVPDPIPADLITADALAAGAGDPDAARRFVAATRHDVWRMLVHLTDRGVAEDLTQETYERAFGALGRFRGESSARTWLVAITRRVAADHLRRARRRPVTTDPPWPDHGDPAADADHAEWVALLEVLATLTDERREAFVITQLAGLGYQEAAEVVGCPTGTIRSRVARARSDLLVALRTG